MGSSQQQWTVALVTAAALLETADEALLPAVYNEVGEALGVSPTALGSLSLGRALVQAVCYPLATCAAARYDRARVVAVGAFLWALATVLVGASATFLQMALARGFNGVGLAVVVPAIYSLVADYSDDTTRGLAFGRLGMAQNMGSMAGNSLGVLLAAKSFLGVVPGWRLAFFALALVSTSIAALTWLLGTDPRPRPAVSVDSNNKATLAQLVREAKHVVKVPTFQIIVAQGVAGSVPGSAFSFATMWLELLGFTHWQTTVITNLNGVANALGALFAGFIGDPLARRFPDTGRIALAQVCTASSVPLAAALLLALPDNSSAGAAYAAAMFFAFGFVSPWCAVSTNNPIFAEIVPEKERTTVYAMDRCFESVFASFAPPLVGVLAERVFGYKPAAAGTSVQIDRDNAAALGKAVFAEMAVPYVVCCLIYTALYWTYPVDREHALQAAAAASGDQDCDCEASLAVHAAVGAEGLNQALLAGTRTE